jgi:transposase
MDNVGIDVHKQQSQICIVSATGEVVLERRIKTTREAFAEAFAGRSKDRVLLEACGESEWIARALEELGHEVIVADPSYEPMYSHRNRKVKTDKRDARVLADAIRLGIFRRAHRKSDEQRHRTALLAVRQGLVRSRTKLIVLAKALVRRTGRRVRTGAAERFTFLLEELELPDDIAIELAPILAVLPALNAEIERADAQLEELARKDERVARLTSVDCIGPVTSVAYLACIDDARRFESAHQVPAYLGIVPREYSSGEKQRKGRITKAGNSELRSLLVQAALRIRRSRSAKLAHLREWSEKIAARRGRKIAVVALARKLSMILFAIVRDGTLFHAPKVAPKAA